MEWVVHSRQTGAELAAAEDENIQSLSAELAKHEDEIARLLEAAKV